MNDKSRMLSGLLYRASDQELREDHKKALRLTRQYNRTTEAELETRRDILHELLGSVKENCYIEPPFRCDYGCHIQVGKNFFANYDCLILDVCKVTIGDDVMLAPRVGIYTAAHPIDAAVRCDGLEYGKPITIGNRVWIGANTVINPGVTIGDDVVIGSGSVVTKDIPSHVIAVGNPCRVLREINEDDRLYWENERKKYDEDKGE